MTTKPRKTPTPTAASRRSQNGLMLIVVVFAAIAIVVILNYVVYWQYRGLSPQAREWVRYDLTSTRRYTLSPQSRGVLNNLKEEHRLVTMLGGDSISDEQQQRIREFIDEYARANKQIQVKHIDLDEDQRERETLLAEMDAMFAEDTDTIRSAILDGLTKLERYEELVNKIETNLKTIADGNIKLRTPSIYGPKLIDLHSQYLRLQDQAQAIRMMRAQMLGEDWHERLKSPGGVELDGMTQGESLPDYRVLMEAIKQYMIQLVRQTLPTTPGLADTVSRGIVIDTLARPESQKPATQAKEFLAVIKNQVPQIQKQFQAETDPLLSVAAPRRYEAARALLNDKPCVLLTSGGDARVLPAELLFRGAGEASENQTNDLFVGEEQLTGAFISMKLDPPPLIVFIHSNLKQKDESGRINNIRALTGITKDQQRIEGLYDHVARRLYNMDFEVVEWENPLREPAPAAKPGQRVVWVSMPYQPPNTNRRESLDASRKDKVAAFLTERLAAGDSALVMLSYNPDTDPELERAGQTDSLVTFLQTFGIQPQLYQSVSRLENENEDPAQSLYNDRFLITDWPESAIVGQALEGIGTFFTSPMPITLDKTEGVIQTPLVELTAPAMHVQRTAPTADGLFTPEVDSERDSVLIGAAAQRGEGRIVTVGDAYWATDQITSSARLPDGAEGPGLADKPGARILFPGNSDLFVNCICWLAHEEDLIAASPRTQDIRRIEAFSPSLLQTSLLWGGMPTAIFVAGLVVWLMRRRA